MRRYLLKRLLLAIPTIVGVTVLIFIVMRVLPGDPLAIIFGENTGIYVLTEEQLQASRRSLGLDKPLYAQYFAWMGDVLRGDFGRSFWRPDPVREIIVRRGAISAQIALMAVAISWVVGLPIGILSAVRRNSTLDYVSRFLVTLFMAVPSFWLGLTFILITVIFFTWKPPITVNYLWTDPLKNLQMTIGPAIAMGIGLGAFIARMNRTTLLEVIREDYVRTARAKGLTERVVILRHALKNSLLPVVTVSGLQLAGLLGGSVAVERAFGVPGLGTALVQAITERDWMVIQNLVLLYAVIFVFVNLAIDLAYGWIDPRVRYG
ncbi:MAG: ABC transporter permease [Chloroflexi bacterium]|nr:ABC transporter permease [Chloroflexota bacterium]